MLEGLDACSQRHLGADHGRGRMRSQALGLAEAVGLPVEEKRISVPPWYAWLPGGFWAVGA
jgi:hypothetical protein